MVYDGDKITLANRKSVNFFIWAGNILLPEKTQFSTWSGKVPVTHESAKNVRSTSNQT
jgi:hypothetical protein